MSYTASFWIAIVGVSISALSIVATLYLNKMNRKYLETNALNELRNKWLKNHYDEIIESMDKPFSPIIDSMPVNSLRFFQPWMGVLTRTIDDNFNIQVSDDYGRHFITDENLFQHLGDREYKTISEKLTNATEDLGKYAFELNALISDIIWEIEDVLHEFVPDAKPTNNYDPTKHEYIMETLFDSILSQLTSAMTNQNSFSFLEMLDDPKLPMLRIWDGISGPAITVPINFSKLKEFKVKLDGIHEEFVKKGKSLHVQNTKIRENWTTFQDALKEIQENYKKSGIPLYGQCDICKKTKEAESLMPLV